MNYLFGWDLAQWSFACEIFGVPEDMEGAQEVFRSFISEFDEWPDLSPGVAYRHDGRNYSSPGVTEGGVRVFCLAGCLGVVNSMGVNL